MTEQTNKPGRIDRMVHPVNSSGKFYELFKQQFRGEKYEWFRLAIGSLEQMLWCIKVSMGLTIQLGGPPRCLEKLVHDYALFLILSPDNEPVVFPSWGEIKPPKGRKADPEFDKILNLIGEVIEASKPQIVYEGRL